MIKPFSEPSKTHIITQRDAEINHLKSQIVELQAEFEYYLKFSLQLHNEASEWEENPLKRMYICHREMESLQYLILVDMYNFASDFCDPLRITLELVLEKSLHVKFDTNSHAVFQQLPDLNPEYPEYPES